MADVLIDTSAWISFFRPGKDPVSEQVEQLVRDDRAVMTGPVLAELLQGTRTDAEARQLDRVLSILPFVEVVKADWEEAGNSLRRLRTDGVTLPLTDALIAAVARRRDLAVLTLDTHFQHLDVPLVAT